MLIKIQYEGKPWLVIYFIHPQPMSAMHLRGDEAITAESLLQRIARKD
jgi:hypothetical protein